MRNPRTSVYLDPWLKSEAMVLAVRQGISFSEYLRILIQTDLKNKGLIPPETQKGA